MTKSQCALVFQIVENGYELSMILEDDVRFVPYFRLRLNRVLREVSGHDYDLLSVSYQSFTFYKLACTKV